jgi:hypothetical protein
MLRCLLGLYMVGCGVGLSIVNDKPIFLALLGCSTFGLCTMVVIEAIERLGEKK